mmetsp:Transcript_74098/g.131021  ORF Transcript_74098/g.131021 Transcript_74098/m.131021 type:complete len:652 (+) Transcript_74098:49-2004(+)|eukprot:CAMPEP_0197633434 /NCGR_PEP_ID=MMETSP1338-20131121/9807_1 /TAXON_ID=43686 ORGANISM="Pelagodinium beii, Strain RCC1491" /NCGR_SAMPLE_ID=MMETSP1338 /ASSEMBLY_ACC=CAM_ASM_000754 /LENGTH=651 /DNA_ID=CAMNT_0043205097 /DNA_START=49 /DNA_END=2004 /DNA_ORIENTATION=-
MPPTVFSAIACLVLPLSVFAVENSSCIESDAFGFVQLRSSLEALEKIENEMMRLKKTKRDLQARYKKELLQQFGASRSLDSSEQGYGSKAPWEYFKGLTRAVRKSYWEAKRQKYGFSKAHMCGDPNNPIFQGQKMWFTAAGCSIASEDLWYVDEADNNELVYQHKGGFARMQCDDVLCPIPPVPDCYYDAGNCAADEWCWTDEHEKWGDWAQATGQTSAAVPNGFTPNQDLCDDYYKSYLIKIQTADSNEIKTLNTSLQLYCPYNISEVPSTGVFLDHLWKPVRGQCVAYRQLGQSCTTAFNAEPFSEEFQQNYVFAEDGNSFERPLLCDPKQLACTGPDFKVLPSTCVKIRPADICFMGPWWDSSDCPATMTRQGINPTMTGAMSLAQTTEKVNAPCCALSSGLTYSILVDALLSMAMLYPTEYASCGSCDFWDVSTRHGTYQLNVREMNYNIAKALWPKHVFGGRDIPSLADVQNMLPNPFNIPGMTSAKCAQESQVEGSQVSNLLARGHQMCTQPNKVWSVVHFLTFNLKSPVSMEQQQAAKAIAVMLEQNFWCNDCRGFWAGLMETSVGLPPTSSNAYDFAHYFWNGHNQATEHIATTRGGNPWIHQLGRELGGLNHVKVSDIQNPFYMTFQAAYNMWVCPDGSCVC